MPGDELNDTTVKLSILLYSKLLNPQIASITVESEYKFTGKIWTIGKLVFISISISKKDNSLFSPGSYIVGTVPQECIPPLNLEIPGSANMNHEFDSIIIFRVRTDGKLQIFTRNAPNCVICYLDGCWIVA